MTYVELAEGAKEGNIRYWTTRQVGLYQRYSGENDYGFCVLLQPQKQSAVQSSIDYLKTHPEEQPTSCRESLLNVHLTILSSYFHNWQSYLTALNNDFEDIVSREFQLQTLTTIMCISCTNVSMQAKMVLTIQWSDLRDYENGQDQLQQLQYLHDRIVIVSPRLRATLEIIATLEALEGVEIMMEAESRSDGLHHRREFSYELKTYKTQTNGLLESSRSLERRMEGILTMVRSTSLQTKP